VDCADEPRLEETSTELTQILGSAKIGKVPVLIFANKQDLATALPADQVTVALDLHKIRDHQWQIQGCSALKGTGLDDGLKWLVQAIK
jgi:ADP-ribosylation factor-like protein 3